MMAMAEPPGDCSFLPLLEPLEDSSAGHAEQIDAYLTIAKCVPQVRHLKVLLQIIPPVISVQFEC